MQGKQVCCRFASLSLRVTSVRVSQTHSPMTVSEGGKSIAYYRPMGGVNFFCIFIIGIQTQIGALNLAIKQSKVGLYLLREAKKYFDPRLVFQL